MYYTVSICTLGCRVNQYESSVIENHLKECGIKIVPAGEKCDLAIINTCTVTGESDRKSRQLIRRVSKNAKYGAVVTGCFAEISPDEASKTEGVCAVIGNKNKSEIVDIVKYIIEYGSPPAIKESTNFEKCDEKLTVPGRVRTFIKIEDGCQSKCAYCIIPKARGPIRSKKPSLILEEADTLVKAGSPEIILTGIEISAYGADFRNNGISYGLSNLIADLSNNAGLKRLALGSLDPSLMTEEFLEKISDSKQLLRHFHLSLQSGCSSVLKRMRRRYNAEQAMEYMTRIKKYFPDAMISADIITGFPGETEEEFSKTADFCRKADFLNMHIFPYSVRAGTEAATMPNQIPEKEKKCRVSMLEQIHSDTKDKLLKKYADRKEPVHVLFERLQNGILSGHSEHYVELKVRGNKDLVGKICEVIPNADGTGKLI